MITKFNTGLVMNYMKKNNLTIKEFCKICKISYANYLKFMKNDFSLLIEELFKILDVLNIRLIDIIEFN